VTIIHLYVMLAKQQFKIKQISAYAEHSLPIKFITILGTITNDYCKKYKYSLIPHILNLAGVPGHGYHQFLKANMPAFGLDDGHLEKVGKLHFSAGKLPLPQNLKATLSYDNPPKVEVGWINDTYLTKVCLKNIWQ